MQLGQLLESVQHPWNQQSKERQLPGLEECYLPSGCKIRPEHQASPGRTFSNSSPSFT